MGRLEEFFGTEPARFDSRTALAGLQNCCGLAVHFFTQNIQHRQLTLGTSNSLWGAALCFLAKKIVIFLWRGYTNPCMPLLLMGCYT